MTQWFDVDKAGLARLIARRGKRFVVFELLQNCWDQQVNHVHLSLEKLPGQRMVTISVEDDDPDGFKDLTHAFTLFAPSTKLDDPEKRGRFNLGEKLVLALCDEAEIITTTGGVRFDAAGRHRLRRTRDKGSLFVGRLRMTNEEFDDCVDGVHTLLPPPGIATTVEIRTRQGVASTSVELVERRALAARTVALPTEIADADGVLRRTNRNTLMSIYEPKPGEVGTLYEMGIPVVETGDAYHVNIGQKIPLNFERDNVTPAYARTVHTVTLNVMHDQITNADIANSAWVRNALGDRDVAPAAVQSMVKLRFGDKAVTYDPSDPEANKLAIVAGYHVVHGNQLSKAEWENVRRTDLLPAAGKVTPSPKPYSDDPDAPMVKVIDPADMTEAEVLVLTTVRRVTKAMLGFEPSVQLVSTSNNFAAAYGGRCLDLNQRRLGKAWFQDCFEQGRLTERAIALLIHECAHEYSDDHLSRAFYDALCTVGAKLALALQNPALLEV
jgi:hypothetical protein